MPTLPTLSISDNADGTGGVATISGGIGTFSNSVYFADGWNGEMKAYNWLLAGTISGNGTISLVSPAPIPLGYYQWLLITQDTSPGGLTYLGNLFYKNLSSGLQAVYYRILQAVKSRVGLLSLDGIPLAKQQLLWRPIQLDNINNPPVLLISPTGAEGTQDTWTNTDVLTFPVLIVLVDALQGESAINLARDIKWRDQIARALKGQRLAGVPEVFECRHYPDAVALPEGWSKNKLVSAMLFRFAVRQTRGLT